MFWHSHRHRNSRFAGCKGRWERLICLWKDLILSFHYGNLTKSFSVALRSVRHLFCQGSFWFALFVCVCLCMLTNARQEVQLVWMSVSVRAPLPSQQNFYIFLVPISVSLVLYVFLKSPPDGNQLPSWLTGKQLQPTLHYSPLAPASPLPSPHFFLSHTPFLSLSAPKPRLLTSNFKWA